MSVDEALLGALQYAIAVIGNHRDVASDFHKPLIQGHMDALAETSQRIEALQAEVDRLKLWNNALSYDKSELQGDLEAAEAKVEALTADLLKANQARLKAEHDAEDAREWSLLHRKALAEGRPSWPPRVEALIAKWRQEAEVRSGQWRGKAAMQRACADELEALLAPPTRLADQAVREQP